MITPSENGSNGRLPSGRFGPGNSEGRGNPYAQRTARLRRALLTSVTPADIADVVTRLVEMAKGGDLAAIKELLDRTIGKVSPASIDVHSSDNTAALAAIPTGATIQVMYDPNWYGNQDRIAQDIRG